MAHDDTTDNPGNELATEYAEMITAKWLEMEQPLLPLGGALIAQSVKILGVCGVSREGIAETLEELAYLAREEAGELRPN